MSLPSKSMRSVRALGVLSEAKPRTTEQRKRLSYFVVPLFPGM